MFQYPSGEAGDQLLRAKKLYREGNHPAAIACYEKALALGPVRPEAWSELGFCYYASRQYEKSLRAFLNCQHVIPWEPLGHFALASCFAWLGRKEPAYRWLRTAAENGFEDWQAVDDSEPWTNYQKEPEWPAFRRELAAKYERYCETVRKMRSELIADVKSLS